MEETNVYFNPETDGPTKYYEGTFPAHIVDLELIGLMKTDTGGYARCEHNNPDTELVISEITFKIAQEINNMTVEDPDTGEQTCPSSMAGKEFKPGQYVIPALNMKPGDEGWKNGKYIQFFENLGIEFPTKKIDKVEVKQVAKVELEDVYGLPVMITLNREKDKNDPEKSYMKVFAVNPWADGKQVTKEEMEEDDLPF